MQTNLGLYTDYLLSSFGQTSATNMARLMDDQISLDDVSRFLEYVLEFIKIALKRESV